VKLKRLTLAHDKPTFGVLLRDDGIPFALTLERPWLSNMQGRSCIPEGRYIAKRHVSLKFGETFWLQDVPGRSEILFHKGNLADDSHGCILVGERFDPVNGQDGIVASKDGFEEFMRLNAGKDEIVVTIEGPHR
jgi:hypothetical protein